MADKNGLWPKADLARRVCEALDVARNAIARLAGEGFVDSSEPAAQLRPEKVISETGVLLLACSTAARHDGIAERMRQVAEALAPYARSERMLLGICTEPALAWDYAQAHICLKRLGYGDERFDSLLERVAKSQAHQGRERPPHRALEQKWAARGFRISRYRATRRVRQAAPAPVRDSALCRPMDLLAGGREDVYAFTHALMYVTDFNIHPWRLPRPRAMILADAEAALARSLDEQDYDLAGEVLLSWPLTGRSWDAAAAFGFRVLAHVEDQAGFLPSAGTRPDRVRVLQGDERARYLLATAYHTAYVMGLLCAVALQPGRAPTKRLRARIAASGVSREALDLLDADPQRPHWREEINQLPDQELEALDSLLLTIGLRRSVVRRDFSRLYKFLQLARKAGLTDMSAVIQAAELLDRLSLISSYPR